jgi:hypothetical protein
VNKFELIQKINEQSLYMLSSSVINLNLALVRTKKLNEQSLNIQYSTQLDYNPTLK